MTVKLLYRPDRQASALVACTCLDNGHVVMVSHDAEDRAGVRVIDADGGLEHTFNLRLDPKPVYQREHGDNSCGFTPYRFRLAPEPQGKFILHDLGSRQMYRFTSSGKLLSQFKLEMNVHELCVLPSGSLLVYGYAYGNSNLLHMYSAEGRHIMSTLQHIDDPRNWLTRVSPRGYGTQAVITGKHVYVLHDCFVQIVDQLTSAFKPGLRFFGGYDNLRRKIFTGRIVPEKTGASIHLQYPFDIFLAGLMPWRKDGICMVTGLGHNCYLECFRPDFSPDVAYQMPSDLRGLTYAVAGPAPGTAIAVTTDDELHLTGVYLLRIDGLPKTRSPSFRTPAPEIRIQPADPGISLPTLDQKGIAVIQRMWDISTSLRFVVHCEVSAGGKLQRWAPANPESVPERIRPTLAKHLPRVMFVPMKRGSRAVACTVGLSVMFEGLSDLLVTQPALKMVDRSMRLR